MEWLEQNVLPLPLWGIVLMLIGSIIAVLFFAAWSIFAEKPWHRVFAVPGGIVSISILIALIVWLTTACGGREVDHTQDCEIKIVTFPDGKSAQMFYAANVNHNANEMFNGIVPDDCVVRRYVYKREYSGIYFTAQRDWLQDTYRIVKKGSEEPQSDPQRT